MTNRKPIGMKHTFRFDYEHFESLELLSADDRELIAAAREALRGAHPDYSNFRVGAAARLESGKIVIGSNQESEVFPATMCAERTLLYHHQATMADDRIKALAIVSSPGERECYPCGQCRQVMRDVEKRQGSDYKVLMCSDSSASVVGRATDLLPFTFEL